MSFAPNGPRLQRDDALKLYRGMAELAGQADTRFAEGRLLARVKQSNVVVVHERRSRDRGADLGYQDYVSSRSEPPGANAEGHGKRGNGSCHFSSPIFRSTLAEAPDDVTRGLGKPGPGCRLRPDQGAREQNVPHDEAAHAGGDEAVLQHRTAYGLPCDSTLNVSFVLMSSLRRQKCAGRPKRTVGETQK